MSVARLDAALAGLDRYGLIETPDPARTHQIATVALHPLVRDTMVQLLERTTDPRPWRDALSTAWINATATTVNAGRDGWDKARNLAPHLPLLTGLASDDLEAFGHARNTVDDLAEQLRDVGAHAVTLGLHLTVLAAERRMLGAEHPEALTSRNNLALVLVGLGEHRRAAELHEETLDAYERVLGSDTPTP